LIRTGVIGAVGLGDDEARAADAEARIDDAELVAGGEIDIAVIEAGATTRWFLALESMASAVACSDPPSPLACVRGAVERARRGAARKSADRRAAGVEEGGARIAEAEGAVRRR